MSHIHFIDISVLQYFQDGCTSVKYGSQIYCELWKRANEYDIETHEETEIFTFFFFSPKNVGGYV